MRKRYRPKTRFGRFARYHSHGAAICSDEDGFLEAAVARLLVRFLKAGFLNYAKKTSTEAMNILNQLCENFASKQDYLTLAEVVLREYRFSDLDLRGRRLAFLDDDEDEKEDDSPTANTRSKKDQALDLEGQKKKLAKALEEEPGKTLFHLIKTGSVHKNKIWLDFITEKVFGRINIEQLRDSNSPLKRRLDDLAKSLGLNHLEIELVLAFFCLHMSSDVPFISSFNEIFCEFHFKTKMNVFLAASQAEVNQALSTSALLRRCNVIKTEGFESEFELDPRITEFLAGFKGESLFSAILEKVDTSKINTDPSDISIPKKQIDLMQRLLRQQTPCQILLYGLPGHGKTTLALVAAKESGREVYQIADRDEIKPADLVSAIRRADVLLQKRKNSVLVVDEADRVICTESAFTLYGERSDKAWLNNLMDSAKGPAMIWITNQIHGIASSTNRRFDLSIGFNPINTRQRYTIWKKLLGQHSGAVAELPEDVIWEFSARYVLAPSIIKNTIEKVAALSSSSVADVISLFREFLDSASELSGRTDRRGKQQVLLPRANYSLDGLNVDVDPAGIIESVKSLFKYLEENPDDRRGAQLNLLLVGPPGTGKTEIVRHMAMTVDRDVHVRRASDLLNPYIGMTERNIAQAFKEAEAANAILFIDECDSMINDRAAAVRSWESTMVNEMLQQMESFRGVLICATNNDQSLDGAAFRRFSVKVRFGYLKEEGRKIFWQKFFPEVAVTDHVERMLCTMNCLAPGDFHAVANRFRFQNGVSPSADDILKALESEVAFKVGKNARSIGYR